MEPAIAVALEQVLDDRPGLGEHQVAVHDRRRDGALDMTLVECVAGPVLFAGRGIEAGDAVFIADGNQLVARALLKDTRRGVGIAALARHTPALLPARGVHGNHTIFAVGLARQDDQTGMYHR